MKHSFAIRAFSLVVLVSCGVAPAFAQQVVPPAITAIHAQLYFEETGAFSDDILARGDLALWNTVIGEGDARHASNSTLVTVEVSGKNVAVGAVDVEIRALDAKGRVLSKSSSSVALYDDRTKFYAPLFLQDTGCEAVTISTRLKGKGIKSKSITRTIPFACGE
ncbi:MAG: hypothetical protein ABMA14_07500 [Hyphomonadaceae bacterium]